MTRLRKNIALSDSGFVFDPSTGNSFTTNPIGMSIIRLLQESQNEERIISALLQEYETEKTMLKRDLDDFLKMLSRLKLIEHDEA
jgi:hypothetical protein